MKKIITAVETYLYHYPVYCGHLWMSDPACL